MQKLAPLFGIELEERARKALGDAILQWPEVERAWDAIEWTLAHDPEVGARLFEGGSLRAFLFDGAISVGWPDIQVIYEASPDIITIRDATFVEAKARYAGHA